jgi:hypothetical protein
MLRPHDVPLLLCFSFLLLIEESGRFDVSSDNVRRMLDSLSGMARSCGLRARGVQERRVGAAKLVDGGESKNIEEIFPIAVRLGFFFLPFLRRGGTDRLDEKGKVEDSSSRVVIEEPTVCPMKRE